MKICGKLFDVVKGYLRDPEVASIARRYLVMNAFDGAMAMLGLVIGAFLARETESRVIISAGLGAAFAMGISGASGAYMAERAERLKAIKKNPTKGYEPPRTFAANENYQALFLAFIDASAPLITSLVSLTPFFFSVRKLIAFENAITISVLLTFATLFTLGTFLGRVAGRNRLRHGITMVLMGVIAFLLTLLVSYVLPYNG